MGGGGARPSVTSAATGRLLTSGGDAVSDLFSWTEGRIVSTQGPAKRRKPGLYEANGGRERCSKAAAERNPVPWLVDKSKQRQRPARSSGRGCRKPRAGKCRRRTQLQAGETVRKNLSAGKDPGRRHQCLTDAEFTAGPRRQNIHRFTRPARDTGRVGGPWSGRRSGVPT